MGIRVEIFTQAPITFNFLILTLYLFRSLSLTLTLHLVTSTALGYNSFIIALPVCTWCDAQT